MQAAKSEWTATKQKKLTQPTQGTKMPLGKSMFIITAVFFIYNLRWYIGFNRLYKKIGGVDPVEDSKFFKGERIGIKAKLYLLIPANTLLMLFVSAEIAGDPLNVYLGMLCFTGWLVVILYLMPLATLYSRQREIELDKRLLTALKTMDNYAGWSFDMLKRELDKQPPDGIFCIKNQLLCITNNLPARIWFWVRVVFTVAAFMFVFYLQHDSPIPVFILLMLAVFVYLVVKIIQRKTIVQVDTDKQGVSIHYFGRKKIQYSLENLSEFVISKRYSCNLLVVRLEFVFSDGSKQTVDIDFLPADNSERLYFFSLIMSKFCKLGGQNTHNPIKSTPE